MDEELRNRLRGSSPRRSFIDQSAFRRQPLPAQPRPSYQPVQSTPRQPLQPVAQPAQPGYYSSPPAEVNDIPPTVLDPEPINTFKQPKTGFKLFHKRAAIIGSLILVVFLVGFGLYNFVLAHSAFASNSLPVLKTGLSKPDFMPLVPEGEPQLAHVNYAKSFNKAHDSYTFKDLYLGVPIQLSEQPMPSNNSPVLTSTQVISSLAKQYKATTSISFKGGTAYVGSSQNQIVIFSYKGLLVFIQPSMNIVPSAWTSYIDKLYQP
jgi:hypothetical protein